MQMPTRTFWISEPSPDVRRLMGREVVEHDVDLEAPGNGTVDLLKRARTSSPVWRPRHSVRTSPVRKFSAAKRPVVPLHLYSCVIVPARPGRSGRLGWVRSSAWTWVFSPKEKTTARFGGLTG